MSKPPTNMLFYVAITIHHGVSHCYQHQLMSNSSAVQCCVEDELAIILHQVLCSSGTSGSFILFKNVQDSLIVQVAGVKAFVCFSTDDQKSLIDADFGVGSSR